MKHLAQSLLLALAVLVLAACSSVVGAGTQLNQPMNHQTQMVGPAADGP